MANLTQIEVNGVTYDLADLISGFVTASVNNLVNYYLKNETYTRAEVEALISQVRNIIPVVTLPTASAETMGFIYATPASDPQTQNVYDEFITVRKGVEGSYTYSWEEFGSASISLDGYVTTSDLAAALADYTTTASLTALLAAKQDVISDLATIRSGAAAGATAYQKPQTGIPASDLASGVIPDVSGKYEKPSGGIPKTDLAQGVQDSLALADSALQSFTETDPTVPAWAKQPSKPSYTAQEVGALPANTSIPSALSDLSEDTTHRVVTDTEKATWNGKQDAIADLATIRTGAGLGATAYQKPATGIPASDMASGVIPDVTGKTDKVSSPTAGNFAGLDANGNLTDSGSKASDFATAAQGALAASAYQKPLTGIPASDLASGVIPDVSGKENTSNKVTSLSAQSTDTQYPSAKAAYDAINPSVQSSQPAGGFAPGVVYDLGTLTGSVTFDLAAGVTGKVNAYHWTFDTGSTAPTVNWPSGVIWPDNVTPTVDTGKHYEVLVRNGYGSILVYTLPSA